MVHGLRGNKFISWQDIRRYRSDGYFCYLEGEATRIRFAYASSDASELRTEISRRAVNSETREWKESYDKRSTKRTQTSGKSPL
jgi:hypothetical protein